MLNNGEPESFIVRGQIRHQDGSLLKGVTVRAFDKDLRSEELLGEAVTNDKGCYQIAYTADQFSRAEKKSADLVVRIFGPEGLLLAASEILFNAPREAQIDLVVVPQEQPRLSEYEQLVAELAPVLQELPLAELTDDDITFLVGETERDRQRIEFLANAARLARDTDLTAEVFYGFARQGLPLELEALLAKHLAELRTALESAIDANIIPVKLRDSLDAIMERLEQLQLERGTVVSYEFFGQLLDQETGAPLSGYTVSAFDLDAGPEPKELGFDITNTNGLFTVIYTAPRLEVPDEGGENAPARRLRLHIIDPKGEEIHQSEVEAKVGDTQVVEIRVPVPEVPEPPSPTLTELDTTLQLRLPPELLAHLANQGIQTLGDIRKAGGIARIEDPVLADHPAVRTLEAHASLSTLSADVRVNDALIKQGYTSASAIASVPRTDFVGFAHADLGDFKAAQLQVVAQAQTQFLSNVVAGLRADQANGFGIGIFEIEEVSDVFVPQCSCKDCEATISPTAYLADLLDYALRHLKIRIILTNGVNLVLPITLDFLEDNFHQPFGDLPTACEALTQQVRQVRMCIEVLRSFLGARPLSDANREAALARSENEYRLAVYTALLNRIGTSYEEIRLARTADEETRQSLADRVGIPLERLDGLFLEPTAVTEDALERLFGLADTTRDPLSEGDKRGDPDPNPQITRWNLDGAEWNRNTDRDGTVYVSLTTNTGLTVFRVELFRDAARTERIASGERTTAQGPVKLSEDEGSGFSGRFEIQYTADTEAIEISAIPDFLSWRLERLRALWYEQDWPEDPYTDGAQNRLPIVDPDVITPDDMRHPEAGSLAFDRWQARRTEVDDLLANLHASRVANGLEHILKQVLGDPLPDLAALLTNLQEGTQRDETVNAITALFLSIESFTRLMEIKGKDDAGQPVEDAEWEEVYALLTQAEKLKRFPDWIAQEAGLILGPKEFWIALEDPPLRKWLALAETRQGWQQTLRAHSQASVIDPDLIGPDYLRDPFAGDAAGLWQARRDFIDTELASVRSAREAETNPRDGFNVILQNTVGVSSDELKDLAGQRDQGNDITGRLDQLSLSNEAFAFLIRIEALLASSAPGEDPLLASEWEDVYSHLTQVLKRREFAAWREEERGQGITLSPGHFKIQNPPAFEFPPREPEPLPAGRATEAALRSWRDVLASRIEQEKSVIEALEAAVSNTEEALLPMLRDALIQATNVEGIGLEAKAKSITDQLLIDAKAGGCQITTRIAQAIETIQILIWSLRTGQLIDTHPTLVLDADDFDEEWKWLGTYNTWRAAMLVFLYPENILLPSLRKWQTPAFKKLVDDLRANPRLTPEQACVAARDYADYFRDVCSFQVEASCQAQTRIHRGEDCRARYAAEYRYLVYFFGRGMETNTVYWSAFVYPEDESGYAQTFWEAVPGLANAEEVIGAVPYRVAGDQRFICLFARVLEAGKQKLVLTRYDLEHQRWDDESTDLEVPQEKNQSVTHFTAVIKQREQDSRPPHLAIRASSGAIYDRKLNQDATGWQDDDTVDEAEKDGDWQVLVSRSRGRDFQRLWAMVELDADNFYLLVQDRKGQIRYRLFGKKEDGYWYPSEKDGGSVLAKSWTGEPIGAFLWPGPTDLYVFWKQTGGGASTFGTVSPIPIASVTADAIPTLDLVIPFPFATVYQAVRSPEPKPTIEITTFKKQGSRRGFDDWLVEVAGLSLKGLVVNFTDQFPSINLLDFFTLDPGELDLPDFSDIKERVYISSARKYIKAIEGYIKDNEEWKEWRFADALVRRLSKNHESLPVVLDKLFDNRFEGKHTIEFRERNDTYSTRFNGAAGLSRIVPRASGVPITELPWFGTQYTGGPLGAYRSTFSRRSEGVLVESRQRLAPRCSGPLDIPERLLEAKREFRRSLIKKAFQDNENGPPSNLSYLEEAYYFVPVHLALQLRQRGQYTAALDWFRTVYDYGVPEGERKIYYGLKLEESLPEVYTRAKDWLLDPLNPHAIAATRVNTYTRFTLLSIIRCFLEFADAEFTRDTVESVARARTLYLTAVELLEAKELTQGSGECDDEIREIDDAVISALAASDAPERIPVWRELTLELRRIPDSKTLARVIKDIEAVLEGEDPVQQRLAKARDRIAQARNSLTPPPTMESVIGERAKTTAMIHAALVAQPIVADAILPIGQAVANDYLHTVSLVTGINADKLEREPVELPWLRQPMATVMTGGGLASTVSSDPAITAVRADMPSMELNPVAPTHMATVAQLALSVPLHAINIARRLNITFIPGFYSRFCVPPNPVLQALRLHAELNLYKLRTCRNIAGDERQLDPYTAPIDVESGLPMIGAGGQVVLPGVITLRPTPYRYVVLIERAKQLVSLAQQIEAALLSTLEKRDAEYFNLLKARQDVRLTHAGVRLQDLRVQEAKDGVTLAELQRDRAQIQVDYFRDLLDEPINALELAALALMSRSLLVPDSVSVSVGGLPPSLSVNVSYSPSGRLQTLANILTTLASYERRRDQWQFERSVAQQDVRIGNQQIRVAQGQMRVVGQERNIAEMQAEHAETTADFLANKFTNVELYGWMSDVLERIYSFFLQQATAMAQLAANQLAFERQNVPPPFILADYWEAPIGMEIGGVTNGATPDRRGLTGSARLLQDIFNLDQYAFETNKRKLQLTKIISLAQLAPAEFQRFRETGVMLFNTAMETFDHDFPGHYLRLINRVRTLVIALIPPAVGVRATLSATGVSRIVIGRNGLFQTIEVKRPPESVALSSPRDATGSFELTTQPQEFLFPFEGMGVDTAWELEMPKAANQFDYNTIADVLITIEYTALNSFDYRQQVIQHLDRTISAEQPFSFRQQFADQWYDLNNPEQSSTPMTVRFTTLGADFPPNIDEVEIQQVLLYFARAGGESFEVPVPASLRFTETGGNGTVGGVATSIDGVISTRRGNALSWTSMIGKLPVGEWELALPNTDEMKKRFKDEEIQDMLFVITYSGRTPAWPS